MSVTFSPRGSSLAHASAAPGSFSSNLKTTNGYRGAISRPELVSYNSREDFHDAEALASEQRQALYRDRINKELKIKTGSENLLEALLSKNTKQAKDQRLKVESELSTSNRKIAELRFQLEQELGKARRPKTPEFSRYSSSFNGSPMKSPSRLEEQDEGDDDDYDPDLEAESPTYVLADILQALEAEAMPADYYVGRANNLVDLFKRYPTLKYDLAWSIFGLRMQVMLLSESREVVAAGYRVIRHAMADRKSLQTIRELQTDTIVMLSLIKDSKASIEREQALKFVRGFLDVKDGVQEISVGVVRTVVAVAGHYEDRLRNLAILTLTEILVRDPALLKEAGGVTTLKDVLGDGNYAGSDGLVSALLHVMDSPSSRNQLALGHEIEAVFAPFTDPLAVSTHEERLKVNGRAIASIFNSWPGLFIMAKGNFLTVRSVLLSLAHPIPLAREVVLDLLFDILHIKPPSWTSSFLAGRRLTTYGRVTNLKPKTIGETPRLENEDDQNRASLVDHFVALTLAILLHGGLLQALASLIGEAMDAPLKRKATLLLGEVLKLMNHALPSSMSNPLQVLPNLSASAFEENDDNHAASTNLIYQIDSVNRNLLKSGNLSKDSNSTSMTKSEPSAAPKANESARTRIDMDEITFRSLLVETQVTNTVNYLKWRWDIIADIIEGPLLNPKRLEDATKGTKFLKRLMGFYRPFKYRFSNARNTKPNQRYVRVGCALMKCLLITPEGTQYLSENKLLRQIAECLAQIDPMSGLTSNAPLFARDRIQDTLTAGYFNILGALTGDPKGLAMLGRWRIINMLYHLIDMKEREDIIQLLLGTMDFSLDSHLRVMLSKALTSSPKAIRIFATKLLRQYATQLPSFEKGSRKGSTNAYWAIRLLVTQLYDPEVDVSEVAVQILQEACDRKQYLEYVVQCRPALDHLGEIGAPLLLRFLSTSLGYQYLNGLDYITQEMDDWYLGRNEKYVLLVEASLSRALFPDQTSTKGNLDEQMPTQENGKVPPHFYHELARTTDGCKLLRASGHFEGFVSTIKTHWEESNDGEIILKVKGCLWAVGNVGSMELGAPFIEDSDVVSWIIKIVEQSKVITMRGTAFFVLGLVSRSLHGAEILNGFGWDVATNHMGQSLGFCLPPSLETLFDISETEEQRLESAQAAQLPHIASKGGIAIATSPKATSQDPLEARVIALVADLCNTVLTNRAVAELRAIKVKKPELFRSPALFQRVVLELGQHNYRLLVRRYVLDMFEKDIMRRIALDESSEEESAEN
ncbi:hypothetical protein MMC25_000302 [Agyrium rufum]|nr:hypothetical protein [Agyrium rufum]